MVITERSIGINGAVFADRRTDVRRRVLKGAVVSFNNGFSTFECVVRSQSENGAALSCAETFSLPQRFVVTLGSDAPRKAEVRWRDEARMGIAFV